MDEQVEVDETKLQNDWRFDPKLRAEFGGNYEAFLAFRKAEGAGQVRILSRKTVDNQQT